MIFNMLAQGFKNWRRVSRKFAKTVQCFKSFKNTSRVFFQELQESSFRVSRTSRLFLQPMKNFKISKFDSRISRKRNEQHTFPRHMTQFAKKL